MLNLNISNTFTASQPGYEREYKSMDDGNGI